MVWKIKEKKETFISRLAALFWVLVGFFFFPSFDWSVVSGWWVYVSRIWAYGKGRDPLLFSMFILVCRIIPTLPDYIRKKLLSYLPTKGGGRFHWQVRWWESDIFSPCDPMGQSLHQRLIPISLVFLWLSSPVWDRDRLLSFLIIILVLGTCLFCLLKPPPVCEHQGFRLGKKGNMFWS